eukprot:scaffold798_cov142-Skeletonema_dohrnii-CCMP3373.AAC.8
MKKSYVLLIAHLFALSAEARLRKKISRDLQEKRSDDGGAEASTRIIGGTYAVEDRFSFAVSLQTSGHFCGGSLIAKDMVLSAAHCAYDGGTPNYDAVIKQHDHSEWWDQDLDRVDAAREYIHPDYSENTNNFDVMVVKLARPTSANVATVKLNSSNSKPFPNASVSVVGWGVTQTGYTSDELKEVEVKAVSQASCRSSYGFNTITDTMLCAADPNEDSCQGDSGGPLFLKGENASEDEQVGIVSWGYGCADSNYPGVYVRVSAVHDFIKGIVCDHSQDEDARSRFQCTSGSSISGSSISGSSITPSPTPDSSVAATDDLDYYDDSIVDDDDDWWDSWTNTVSNWWDSWWN